MGRDEESHEGHARQGHEGSRHESHEGASYEGRRHEGYEEGHEEGHEVRTRFEDTLRITRPPPDLTLAEACCALSDFKQRRTHAALLFRSSESCKVSSLAGANTSYFQ